MSGLIIIKINPFYPGLGDLLVVFIKQLHPLNQLTATDTLGVNTGHMDQNTPVHSSCVADIDKEFGVTCGVKVSMSAFLACHQC